MDSVKNQSCLVTAGVPITHIMLYLYDFEDEISLNILRNNFKYSIKVFVLTTSFVLKYTIEKVINYHQNI